MSQSLLLHAHLRAKHEDPDLPAKEAFTGPEVGLHDQPGARQAALTGLDTYETTFDRRARWDPAKPTSVNSPDVARSFTWVNTPPLVPVTMGKVGRYGDDSHALRNMPTDKCVPDYQNPKMPAGVHAKVETEHPGPGWVALPRGW